MNLSVQTLFSQGLLDDHFVQKLALEFAQHRLIRAVSTIAHAVLLLDVPWAIHAFKCHNSWSEQGIISKSSLILSQLFDLLAAQIEHG